MNLHKMITSLFLCVFVLAPCCAWSAISDREMIDKEIGRMDTLISATERTLDLERQVKSNLIEYQRAQQLFVTSPEDNDVLLKMVIVAHKTLTSIQEARLEYTFDPDFISELKFLSTVSLKRGIPKP